mgnify:CR=1 FL=1
MKLNMPFKESVAILNQRCSANEQFAGAVATHWRERPDFPGEVLAQSYCWLYCWCTTGGPANDAATDGAQKAFSKIFRPYGDFVQLQEFDRERFRDFAAECRYRVGDYEQELQEALKELFGPA